MMLYCRYCGYRVIGSEEDGFKHLNDDGRIVYLKHQPKPEWRKSTALTRNYWSND